MAHTFESHLEWSGSAAGPTRDAATFSRNLDVMIDGITLPMSSAPAFRGDPSRANPEQLYVAALSACHALTFLFLAARGGVAVTDYVDDAIGELAMENGKMQMTTVTLRPVITLDAHTDVARARGLLERAHRDCFIGNSVTARVEVEPRFELLAAAIAS